MGCFLNTPLAKKYILKTCLDYVSQTHLKEKKKFLW